MTEPEAKATRLDRAQRNLVQAMARLEVAHARARARNKRDEATRHYRLGLVLESFLFDEPALLAEVEMRIREHAPRVRAVFALDRSPSWFALPTWNDPKKVIDTRRYRLGMVLERTLPGDAALSARVEALIREQATYVRDAFGMEGDGLSWFDERRAVPAQHEHGPGPRSNWGAVSGSLAGRSAPCAPRECVEDDPLAAVRSMSPCRFSYPS